jgi:hypothetical protein
MKEKKSFFIKYSVVIQRVVNVMPNIFVVVLRMLTALGYEFDECVARVESGSALEMNYLKLLYGLDNISFYLRN